MTKVRREPLVTWQRSSQESKLTTASMGEVGGGREGVVPDGFAWKPFYRNRIRSPVHLSVSLGWQL